MNGGQYLYQELASSQGRVAKHSVSGESSEAHCPPLTSSAAIVGLISSLAAGTTTTSQAALLGSGDTSPAHKH